MAPIAGVANGTLTNTEFMRKEGYFVLLGIAVYAAFYGGLAALLYWRVRRHAHPNRSMWFAFPVTLVILLIVAVGSVLAAVAALEWLADPRVPRAAVGFVGVAVVIFTWMACRAWLASDPALSKLRAKPQEAMHRRASQS